MKITEFELGWLIGILEGEGCFDYQSSNSARIRLAMTDEDTILRATLLLQKLIGKELNVRVYTPKGKLPKRQEWQQAYAVALYAKDAEKVMRLIVKHMSVRRRKRIWQTINGHRPEKIIPVKLDLAAIVTNISASSVIPIKRRA